MGGRLRLESVATLVWNTHIKSAIASRQRLRRSPSFRWTPLASNQSLTRSFSVRLSALDGFHSLPSALFVSTYVSNRFASALESKLSRMRFEPLSLIHISE